ncbi:MAG: GGDEF domain-containing phosphodiesterase [Gallionella sp.]|nr:GGDEF domain-containing phosphodiesterase [Gallionella sp.]MDD4946641.1 GGDEF domain-containing phosphodiesterase [Gallionella sp.]
MSPANNRSNHQDIAAPIAGFVDRNHCLSQLADLASASTYHPLAICWIVPDIVQPPEQNRKKSLSEAFLTLTAQRLHRQTGAGALWCRMSPDEFVCVLTNHDFDRTNQLATKLLNELQACLTPADQPLQGATSMGIAFLDSNENPYACLERAHQAMNTARRSGGNRIVVSGSEPLPGRTGVQLARHELVLENRLYRTIDEGRLTLHYQPCMDVNGCPVSIEALLRCEASGLSTADAIPIAEKTGLIVRLGEWSMLEAARMARRLSADNLSMPVSINISRAQLTAPRFSQMLHAALLCADASPQQFELELSESLLQDHSRTVQSNLRTVQAAGFNFVIDDFGSTHSCLANLKNITTTKIKLDRKFTAALPYDQRSLSVVTAMARLAAEFGTQIVAKGVETTTQLDALHQAGIYVTQGYLHAAPMPENELRTWLKIREKRI